MILLLIFSLILVPIFSSNAQSHSLAELDFDNPTSAEANACLKRKLDAVLSKLGSLKLKDVPIDYTYLGYRTRGKLLNSTIEGMSGGEVTARSSSSDLSHAHVTIVFPSLQIQYQVSTRVRGPKVDSPIRASTRTTADHLHTSGELSLRRGDVTRVELVSSATRSFTTEFEWDSSTPQAFREPMQQLANSVWFYNLQLHQFVDEALNEAIKRGLATSAVSSLCSLQQ